MLILSYPLLFIFELLISIVAVLLSPVLALFAVTRDSNPWCSAPGPRQYLRGWLQLFSTHDDGVDALWYQGLYDDRDPDGWAEKARAGSRWARYVLRVLWIVRNSAYGFAHYFMGFDRSAGFTTRIVSQRGKWDSDTTNWLIRVDTTAEGKKAFQVQAQLFFTKERYVRLNLGWKLTWDKDVVQIATHINPFRKWKTATTE